MLNFCRTNTIQFGAHRKYGSIGDINPQEYVREQISKISDGTTPEEIRESRDSIKSIIKKQHPYLGMINPTLEQDYNKTIIYPAKIIDFDPKYIELDRRINDRKRKCWEEFHEPLEDKFGEEFANLYKDIMNSDTNSPEFIKLIIAAHEFFAKGYEVEINLESHILDKLVQSDESTIFILNHPNPHKDISLCSAFISELYKAYEKHKQSVDFPRPKYIISDIIEKYPRYLSEIHMKVGAVPVDASPYPSIERSIKNGPILSSVISEFIEDRSNIITFPEGRRSSYRNDLQMEERFQCGIAKMVQKALDSKNRVRVVSIGLCNDGHKGIIHIGNPIYFQKEDNKIYVSKGNMNSSGVRGIKGKFYHKLAKLSDNKMMPIYYAGLPVEAVEENRNLISRLISGILCTDLTICSNNAAKIFKKKFVKT